MSDLISREAAVQMLREKAQGYFVSMFATSGECHVARVVATECAAEVKNLPAVDAVEVVRCKDCAFYIPWGNEGKICGRVGAYYGDTKPDDFCSRSVRMDEEE
jgi:hypothetical protein